MQSSTGMWYYSGILCKQTCQHSHERQQTQQWSFWHYAPKNTRKPTDSSWYSGMKNMQPHIWITFQD